MDSSCRGGCAFRSFVAHNPARRGAECTDGAPQLTIVPPSTVEHNENDDGPVYIFVATDPEGKTIFWTLSGTDADDFMIEDGVLKFKNAPNFEIMLDATTSNTPVADSDGVYEVTVRFSDGGTAGSHAIKVDVQDVEEDGMIMLSPLQPQVGTPLEAVIIELDGVSRDASGNPEAEYQWAKADSMSGTYADIAGAVSMSYTPTEDDEDSYLQVTVTYLEHASGRTAKTGVGQSDYAVRADTHANEAPVVPTTGQGQMRTGADDTNAIIRYIAEDAAVGDEVGPPVTAVDDNRDMLTYAFGGTDDQMDNAAPFDVDPVTGQITTNRALDFDEMINSPVDSEAGVDDIPYTTTAVVVTATDPDGEVEPIRVDIRITDVDEARLFTLTVDPDGSTGAANRERSIVEGATGNDLIIGTYTAADPDNTDATIVWSLEGDDADSFEFDDTTTNQLQFTATPDYDDPGDENGDNLYELTVVASDGTMESRLPVTVKVTNDPTDDDYNAPVTAFDIFNRQPEVNTLLKVEGDPVDPDGSVRSVRWQWYWQTIAGATADAPESCPAFVPLADNFDPQDPSGETGDPDINPGSPWMKIEGAESSSYMPTLDRVDTYDTVPIQPDDRATATAAFDCLMVRASYLDDGPRLANESTTPNYDESRQYAYAVSDFTVQPHDTINVAPEFQDGDTALAGTQIRLRVLENFPYDEANEATGIFNAVALATAAAQYSTAGVFITEENMAPDTPTLGDIRILDGTFPTDDDDGIIEATDGTYDDDDFESANTGDNVENHKLTFAIGGTDDEHFVVDKATGAITFTDDPDYEILAEKRYTVTLTAHDPTNRTDSITIILDVENIDEDPTFVDPTATANFKENSTDPVATYMANDPEGVDDYSWGLTGTDAALFDLSVISGRLTFRNAPNFEDPEDVEGNNVYNVVVHLLLDGETVTDEDTPDTATPEARTQSVAITVVDVDEDPVFTKTTDDDDNVVPTPLNIAENKQPNTDLNRPVENSPQASDEDQIPEDAMYSSVALMYTISGTGTEAFSIVPATGELRTTRVLDYESGDRSFAVKVTATDPTGLDDSIDLIINVTDEDEAPVGGGTNQAPQFASEAMTRSVAENTDAEMEFGDPVMATDPEDGNVITHSLGGADAGHFDIDVDDGAADD